MWDTVLDILADAALDSLMILPFLLIMHIAIEVFEAHAATKMKVNKILSSPHAPFFGGAVGLIPQCGFSVVATKLYAKRNIKLGTLLAVYIATSDEAVPILLSTPSAAIKVLPLLGLKLIFALALGYGVNAFLKKSGTVEAFESLTPPVHSDADGESSESLPHVHGHDGETHDEDKEEKEIQIGCHGHEIGTHEQANPVKAKKRFDFSRYIYHPALHSMTILLFIFAVNLVLGTIIHFVGEDRLTSAMNSISLLQPLFAALIGLIPNCASSVVITQMYAVGSLSLGAAFAGLSVNAGIAVAVLFKENKNLKQNLKIVGGLYLASVAVGTLVTALMNALG